MEEQLGSVAVAWVERDVGAGGADVDVVERGCPELGEAVVGRCSRARDRNGGWGRSLIGGILLWLVSEASAEVAEWFGVAGERDAPTGDGVAGELAGVVLHRCSLPAPVDGEPEVDVASVSRPTKPSAELGVEGVGDVQVDGPGEHGQVVAFGDRDGGGGRVDVVRVAGDAGLVEHQQQIDVAYERLDLGDQLVDVDGGESSVGMVELVDGADAEFAGGRSEFAVAGVGEVAGVRAERGRFAAG